MQYGKKNHRWLGNKPNPGALHQRVRAHRGKAADHACVDCGKPAKHWSNVSQKYKSEKDFAPRCARCHVKYDGVSAKMSKHLQGNTRGKGNKGKVRSLEFRAKVAASHIGVPTGRSWNKGKKTPASVRAKQRAARLNHLSKKHDRQI